MIFFAKHSKTNFFKMNRFLFRGTLTRFLFNLTRLLSKIVNWVRGQRSNKSLIFVRNIEVGFLCLFVIFLTSIKLVFDIWPLIQITIFEEEPCKCHSEEESIHFKEVCFRVQLGNESQKSEYNLSWNVFYQNVYYHSFTPIQNLKSLVKTRTLNAGTHTKEKPSKFLKFHSPFCLIIRKYTQTEWPSWVLLNLLLLVKLLDAI